MGTRRPGGAGHTGVRSASPAPPASAKERQLAVIFGFSVALMLALPLPLTQAKGIDFAAAAVGVLGLMGTLILFTLSPSLVPTRRLSLAWMAFLGWALIVGLGSHRIWASMVGEPTNMLGWFSLLALTSVAMVGYRLREPLRELLLRYGWIMVLFQSALALYQRIVQGNALAAGTLSNSTNLGMSVLLLLPWALPPAGVLSVRQVRTRLAVGALAVVALVATASRLSALIAIVWLVWATLTRSQMRTTTRWAIVSLLLAVTVGTAVSLSSGEFAALLHVDVLGQRPAIYVQALRAIAARPVTGWGTDGFLAGGSATATLEHARAGSLPTFGFGATDPHNLALWVGISTGIVGLLLFSWFAAEALAAFRKARREHWAASAAWSLGGSLVVALTAPFALHVLPLFAAIFAASLAAERSARIGLRVSVPARRGAALASIALVSVVLAANAATRAYLEEPGQERSALVVDDALAASNLWEMDAHLAYLSSLHLGWSGLAQTDARVPKLDLERLGHAVAVDGHNPIYALERARATEFYGRSPAEVDAAFDQVFERYPANALAHAEYAAYLADTDRWDEAEEELALARLSDDQDPELLAALDYVEAALEDAPIPVASVSTRR